MTANLFSVHVSHPMLAFKCISQSRVAASKISARIFARSINRECHESLLTIPRARHGGVIEDPFYDYRYVRRDNRLIA